MRDMHKTVPEQPNRYPCRKNPLRVLSVGCVALLLASLLLAHGYAQNSSTPPAGARPSGADQLPTPGYTLKVSTQLVVLDVVVRNAKGEIVPRLKAEDFIILEDKIPQAIRSFEFTSPNLAASGNDVNVNSTAELDRLRPRAPVTILVLDEIVTRFEDQYFARYSIDKYLSKQGETLDQPTMLIARRMDRTIVLSDYTNSKQKIRDALEHHLAANDWASTNPNFVGEQTAAAFASLLQIARATEGHQGHKNLVWIGRGFPTLQWNNMQADQIDSLKQAVASCVETLREARVTLYVIDPAGVAGYNSTSDENGVLSLEDPFDNSVGFDGLARATGGAAMHGRNDVDRLIGNAVAGGETFYTLTYRPSTPVDQDSQKFRNIQVVLRQPSLTATSRVGYYPDTVRFPLSASFNAAAGRAPDENKAAFDLASASTGLMVFDGLPLTLSWQTSPVESLRISFPASALGLTAAKDKLRGDLTLLALSFDKSGKIIAKDGRVVSLHLAELPAGHTEDRTINLSTPIRTNLPIARVRVVVRSEANGKLGAENFYPGDKTSSRIPSSSLDSH